MAEQFKTERKRSPSIKILPPNAKQFLHWVVGQVEYDPHNYVPDVVPTNVQAWQYRRQRIGDGAPEPDDVPSSATMVDDLELRITHLLNEQELRFAGKAALTDEAA